jgi:hypothetical protein
LAAAQSAKFGSDAVQVQIAWRLQLSDEADTHRLLEAQPTTGWMVLIPCS